MPPTTGARIISLTPADTSELMALLRGQASPKNGNNALQPGDFFCLIVVGRSVLNGVAGTRAGDQVHLGGGTYSVSGLWNVALNGNANNYIVIRSAPGQKAIINRPGVDQNIMDVVATYTYWYDLEFSGGSAGIRVRGDSHHNTWDKINVHDTEDVLFRANDSGSTVHDNVIMNSELHHSGAGVGGTAEAMCKDASAAPAAPAVRLRVGASRARRARRRPRLQQCGLLLLQQRDLQLLHSPHQRRQSDARRWH